MARGLRTREQVGRLDAARLEAAVATGCPVVPVALVGREAGRSWRVAIGAPASPSVDGGPLAAAELADTTRHAVQALLDDALPPSWWP
jgi:hypothetical protein